MRSEELTTITKTLLKKSSSGSTSIDDASTKSSTSMSANEQSHMHAQLQIFWWKIQSTNKQGAEEIDCIYNVTST